MSREEAILKAKAFVLEHVGVEAEAASVRLMTRPGVPSYWSVVYMPEAICPAETARGAVIDGPYVLHVDDASGVVSVSG